MLYLAVICIALVCLLAYRERVGARERRELYQRIQAPQMAVREHAAPPKRERKPVKPQDAYMAGKHGG